MTAASLEHALLWLFGIVLGVTWISRLLAVLIHRNNVPEITTSEFDRQPQDAEGRVPRVSIIVPARNEAEHIEAALLSLLELDYPDYEVIAINDRSDDATGAILDRLTAACRELAERSHHRLSVLHVQQLPPGWLGKVHAMWAGAGHASGDWLLFTDADVVFRADALRRAVVYAERERADHVVLFPTMIMRSAGERMMMAFFQSQFLFAHRPWKVSDPRSRDSIGVGAFNLVRRSVYQDTGGYSQLRMAVLDDMKLGELVKRNGYTQRCAFGRDLLRLRWVVGTLGMVRNLTKNFFAILRFSVPFAICAICGVAIVNLGPYVGVWFVHGWARAGYLAALASIFAMYIGMSTKSDISPLYFFLHPVGTALFVYAMARSMIVTLARGGIDWRGTWYSLQDLRRFEAEAGRWGWL